MTDRQTDWLTTKRDYFQSKTQLNNPSIGLIFPFNIGEFGSDFKSYILRTYNIKSYVTVLGHHRKNSLCERVIRTAKMYFFRLLLSLKTSDYTSIIKLVQFLINCHSHRGLHGFSPYMCHFSSHVSSTVAKLNQLNFALRQTESMSFYLKTPPKQRISIGSKVKIKLKRNIFRKNNPIFNSGWSESIYTVTDSDSKQWPIKYFIRELPNHSFYSYQLLKVPNSDPIITSGESPMQKIQVLDIEHTNSFLRNNKIIPSRHEIKYRIMKNGSQELVRAQDLLLFKKIYGNSILEYSNFFAQKENVSYVI